MFTGLKKKVGPLPLWAWCMIAGIGIGGTVLYVRTRNGGTTTLADASIGRAGVTPAEYAPGGSGAGGGGSGDWFPELPTTGGTESVPETVKIPDYTYEPVDMDPVSTSGGGVAAVAGTAPKANVKQTLADQRLTDRQKEQGFVAINRQEGNPRAGKPYKVATSSKTGQRYHVYEDGTKIAVKTPANAAVQPKTSAQKSTATTNTQKAPSNSGGGGGGGWLTNNQKGNPRYGQQYKQTTDSKGRKVNTYKDGTKVVIK